MLQIIGALCIFFFIIVPIVNSILSVAATPDTRSSEQKVAAKHAYQTEQKQKAYVSDRKKLIFFIKYPYLIPGIFALFVILGSLSSPPQVNRLSIDGWTVAITIMFSYLYRLLMKSSLRKLDSKYIDSVIQS